MQALLMCLKSRTLKHPKTHFVPVLEIECIPKTGISGSHCIPIIGGVYHVCVPTFKSVYHTCPTQLDLRWICAFSRHHFKRKTLCCTDV